MIAVFALCLLAAFVNAQDPVLNGSQDKPLKCEGLSGNNLEQFWDPEDSRKKGGKKVQTAFPCKFWALRRQACGQYRINVSPGMKWVHPKFQYDTLWISIIDTANNNAELEARVTNKQAAKFFNTNDTTTRPLFQNKNGGDESNYEYTRDNYDHWNCIQDTRKENGVAKPTFQICFKPWSPDERYGGGNDKQPWMFASDWKFECFEPNTVMDVPMPDQFCGNGGNQMDDLRKLPFYNLPKYDEQVLFYHNMFNNSEIIQTNEQCVEATNTYIACPMDRQIAVMRSCSKILSKDALAKCVSRNAICSPMDAFNSCLKWGCEHDFQAVTEEAVASCNVTAEALDFCTYHEAITPLIEEAKCYKDFVMINKDISESA